MKITYAAFLATLFALPLFSQTINPWQTVEEQSFTKADMDRRIIPDKYKTYSLDFETLKKTVKKAPMRFSEKAKSGLPVLQIPMPDGQYQNFHLMETAVMHPELAAKFPEIKTYSGWSENDPSAILHCGISQKGFHGMVLSAKHSSIYIDVYAENITDKYICYFKKNFIKNEPFNCHFDEISKNKTTRKNGEPAVEKMAGDCQFRVYQLALSCTGEYAQLSWRNSCGCHGGI